MQSIVILPHILSQLVLLGRERGVIYEYMPQTVKPPLSHKLEHEMRVN